MTIEALIDVALVEDGTFGDVTSEAIVPPEARGIAELLCKETGIVAGMDVAGMVFSVCDPSSVFRPLTSDGRRITEGLRLATAEGPLRALLRAERVALNFLQRMSGIATATQAYVDAVSGTGVKITDTRKTAPGLRLLDKMAVRAGGGVNHRFGLDDMFLIKDNHVVAAGGVTRAVELCRMAASAMRRPPAIELEVRTLPEVREALACDGIQRIMLDNFPLEAMREAVDLIDHRLEVEASGGITLRTVRAVAETGVDLISVGALTHSVKALDISLEVTAV
jgi:nicotinate-nucleotide pyrophosphorylase (carboxylating)